MLDNALTVKCFIYDVGRSYFTFSFTLPVLNPKLMSTKKNNILTFTKVFINPICVKIFSASLYFNSLGQWYEFFYRLCGKYTTSPKKISKTKIQSHHQNQGNYVLDFHINNFTHAV